ncbi:tyrosine kinase domain protein [Rhizoctonia solani AG-3 Rhs1AP]|uniref:Tyrosine kinase domain protein n=2 Tax=Rhizoctonia solani AG-3 TaxID=1086053 RepID=A0A074S716_9AGAM|nr:tyrosine kinase domain protein [Rhizoctonia solani AG-3 Rhs1AP]KEP45842.1 tyrosine kinase domain protein [Rhizoctonia solani 123E]
MSSQSEGAIGSATSVGEIIAVLAKRGCADLTEHINWAGCGSLPVAGGGFCDVYQGELYNSTKIAIRSLRIFDSHGEDNQTTMLKNAAKEIYHWSKLRHQNVLSLMGLAIYRGQISMVSEWMTNGNLSQYLIKHPEANRLALSRDMGAGLHHIHSQDMVHGDLKAVNVMISPEGVAMIADFGNARLKELTLQFTGTTLRSVSLRWAVCPIVFGRRQ